MLGVRPLVIGVTVVACGTSAPELVAGRFLLPPVRVDDLVATTAHEAEGSTEL